MCLMLYLGAAAELPPHSSADLKIEPVAQSRESVTLWFQLPAVRFVGAHTGCSCGFPSVTAESPIAYFEGMSLASDNREADLGSVKALMALLGRVVGDGGFAELYPVADGDESEAPKGVIEWRLSALDAERFFFNERFMHVVRAG